MSEGNAEQLRRTWEAAMKRDPTDLDLSFVDPDVVYEDDILPDHAGETYHGHEGIRKAWARAIEPWESFENEIVWAQESGDDVVSCHRMRVKGHGSGIAGEIRYAYLWRFREGKVVYCKSFRDPAQALEVAGLSE
jgi:ketosteroid isomerase-like protein